MTFREYLQNALLERCRSNRAYSLRSFARSLSLSPSSLSRILRGERPVSRQMMVRLGQRLGLKPQKLQQFPPDDSDGRHTLQFSKTVYHPLSEDEFSLISDWYHFAILELIAVKGFEPEVRWVARALGIKSFEVQAAVERLVRLKLIRISRAGKWVNIRGSNTNASGKTYPAAYRALQRQVLEKALEALDQVPIERRDQTAMTMAISTKRLPEAIRRIDHFRRELCAFLEKDRDRDDVYHLSVSLYPVTKLKEESQ